MSYKKTIPLFDFAFTILSSQSSGTKEFIGKFILFLVLVSMNFFSTTSKADQPWQPDINKIWEDPVTKISWALRVPETSWPPEYLWFDPNASDYWEVPMVSVLVYAAPRLLESPIGEALISDGELCVWSIESAGSFSQRAVCLANGQSVMRAKHSDSLPVLCTYRRR